jgi:1,4-dihydroxy-2-naphthoate octaprenyltransferase
MREYPVPEIEIKFWTSLLRFGINLERWEKLNIFLKFFVLVRGVALFITFFSVIIGGLLSYLEILGKQENFHLDYFLVALLGLIFAHSASNLINDWWDYKNKVDTPEYFRSRYNLHPLSLISEKKLLILTFFLLLLAFISGIYLTYFRGIPIIILTFLGFIIMFFYSGKPFSFKYRGIGEPLVFLTWGPLMIGGIFYVLTGRISFWAILGSIPYGLSTMLVLLGKHLDKIEEDRRKNIRTLPVILGEKNTIKLSIFVIFLMHLFPLLLIFTEKFNFGPLLTLLALPRSIRGIKYVLLAKKPEFEELPDFYPRDAWPLWYAGGAFILNSYFATFYLISLIFQIFLNFI